MGSMLMNLLSMTRDRADGEAGGARESLPPADLLTLCLAEETAMRSLAARYAALRETIHEERTSWQGLTLNAADGTVT